MRKLLSTSIAGIVILLISSCSGNSMEELINEELHLSAKKQNEKIITIQEQDLFPEGIEYDKRADRFLLTSITRGNIGQVINGVYSEWISDEDLVSTIGIHIDQSGKRVLVANSDLGFSEKTSEGGPGSLAALAAYDLDGNRIFYTDLGNLKEGAHFANDVTVDNKGNAYVTDSFSGVIYKVDPQGNPEIFYENDEMAPPEGSFGFNGIDYDPRGFLLVVRSDVGEILRFPIDDPENFTVINLPEELHSPDGLYLKTPNELVVVNNDFGGENANTQIFKTRNKWKSAKLIHKFEIPGVFPTTATVKRSDTYVLYAHLDVLLNMESKSEFSIVKIE